MSCKIILFAWCIKKFPTSAGFIFAKFIKSVKFGGTYFIEKSKTCAPSIVTKFSRTFKELFSISAGFRYAPRRKIIPSESSPKLCRLKKIFSPSAFETIAAVPASPKTDKQEMSSKKIFRVTVSPQSNKIFPFGKF